MDNKKTVIGEETLRKANAILRKYKSVKTSLEQNVI